MSNQRRSPHAAKAEPQEAAYALLAAERATVVAHLMRAFVIHGMSEHVHRLQAYESAAQRGQAGVGGCWSDAFVLRWAAMFRLPPYDEVFNVRRSTTCDACPDVPTHVSGKFPGGRLVKCGSCELEWLVKDAEP